METKPPRIEPISRQQLADFISSKPLVLVHLRGVAADGFNREIAVHFQTDYPDMCRFGFFNYNEVLSYQAWLPKYFASYSEKGDGYYLFLNGKCVASNNGNPEPNQASAEGVIAIGSIIAALAKKSLKPIEFSANLFEKEKAKRIISHFEPIIQILMPIDNKNRVYSAATGSSVKKKSPHEILGISVNASAREIKAAYHTKMEQNHPDKVSHLSEAIKAVADAETRAIQQAYEQLRKSKKAA